MTPSPISGSALFRWFIWCSKREIPFRVISLWYDLDWSTSLAGVWTFTRCDSRTIGDGRGARFGKGFWVSRKMMNSEDFGRSPEIINFSSHSALNPLILMWNTLQTYRQKRKQHLSEKRQWRAEFSLEWNFWSCRSFSGERTSVNIIFWPLCCKMSVQKKHRCEVQWWQQPTACPPLELDISEWV
jgi:hypothetical protein